MARIGYARVSTSDQDTDLQCERLKAEGCSIVRAKKVSGANREEREKLETILAFLRPGDELVVMRLDRLGRDTRDVLKLIHECESKGAFVTVLGPHVSTRGEMGHIILNVLGMVATMERRFNCLLRPTHLPTASSVRVTVALALVSMRLRRFRNLLSRNLYLLSTKTVYQFDCWRVA